MGVEMLNKAREYVFNKGFSVIPLIPREKKPIIKWEEYQKRKPTEEELVKWFGSTKNNIGIVAGEISNLSIIDMDGKAAVDFMTSGHNLPVTPMVKTGKDYGYHLYCRFNAALRNFQARADLPSIDLRSEGGYVVAPPSIHPNGKQYEWVSGTSIPCAEVPAWFLALVSGPTSATAFNKESFIPYSFNININLYNSIFGANRKDNDLFHVGNAMGKGGIEPEYILKVLELLINSWGENDPKWAEEKVKSIMKRIERKEKNIAAEVREFVLSTSGHFLSTEVHKSLHLSTKEEMKAASMALSRLVSPEKVLERCGNKNGCFRLIEKEETEIDFKNAKGDFLDVKWPFEIEKYFKTAPKNIIIVAGEPDAGKTAFLLNFAALNNFKSTRCFYFSSEMGEFEMRERLKGFVKPTIDGWRMKVYDRSSNFADVIRPDDINIIDFLEIHDEFYKVGLYIKQIFDKLNKGIAVIALQKNPGKDQGLGGMRSIEKARLALNMERGGRMVIDKAKNWASMNNPRGLAVEYKLVNGCQFQVIKDWHYADGIRQLGEREAKQKEYQEHWNNQF
jgi:hypothetical protein